MATACNIIFNDLTSFPIPNTGFHRPRRLHDISQISIASAIANTNCSDIDDPLSSSKIHRKKPKSRLITISASDGKWHGNWNCDYTFSLQQLLQQHDLLDDEVDKNAEVSISLCIQKHSGLGLSVEGRIKTSFIIKCCNCCNPFLRQIDAPFKVWILPSRSTIRKPQEEDDPHLLHDIGVDDPSVIYVKPGSEADLDSFIQDTFRLATSVRETCSKSCADSEPKMHYLGPHNSGSLDKRWSKLLTLKNNVKPPGSQASGR